MDIKNQLTGYDKKLEFFECIFALLSNKSYIATDMYFVANFL